MPRRRERASRRRSTPRRSCNQKEPTTPSGATVNTASPDPANRPTPARRIDFRPGMDMWWEIVRNGEDTDGEVLEVNAWLGPRQPSPPVHVHDNAEDSFEIVEGRLDVKLDGTWRTYGPGERAAATPGHRHTLRNAHDQPVRFVNRHRPAADYEGFFRDMASLTSTGKMGAGTPHSPRQAIYAAMLFKAHPSAIRTSGIQRFAFASLSGLGRMLGMSI